MDRPEASIANFKVCVLYQHFNRCTAWNCSCRHREIFLSNSAISAYDRPSSKIPMHSKAILSICLLYLAALQPVTAQSRPAAVTAAAGATAGAAVCSLSLVGFGDRLGIKNAKLSCTGGTITIAAHKVLEDFWGPKKALPGVVWGNSTCIGNKECLLTVCSQSNAVFDSATVTALQGGGTPALSLVVCVNRRSTVTFRKSSFTLVKEATPLGVHNNYTSVLLEQCTFQSNAFTTTRGGFSWSGGIVAEHSAVTIVSSTIAGNVASGTPLGSEWGRECKCLSPPACM
jgi:hypothetical protein